MYVVLALGVVAFGLAVGALVALATGRRRPALVLGGGALVGAGITVGAGGASYAWAMTRIFAALAAAQPALRARLLEQGIREAMCNVWLGAVLAAFPLLAGAVALVGGLLTQKEEG